MRGSSSVQCEIFFFSMPSSSLFNAEFSFFECAGSPSAGERVMEAMAGNTDDNGSWQPMAGDRGRRLGRCSRGSDKPPISFKIRLRISAIQFLIANFKQFSGIERLTNRSP
jgi:hypothetical protein